MLADIIHIRSDGQIGIKAWIIPNELAARFAALNAKKDFHLQFLVQAQSLEQDSVDLKIGFDWNGIWVDGDAEITNHVRIREIAPPSPVTGYSP
jgi:hypothetical protein